MDIIRTNGYRDFANFRDIQFCYEGFVVTDHTWRREKPQKEPYSCLYYVAEGSGVFLTDDERVEFTAGNLYFLPSGASIGFYSTPSAKLLFCHVNLYIYGIDVFENTKKIIIMPKGTEHINTLIDMYLCDDRYQQFLYKGEIYKAVCEAMKIIQGENQPAKKPSSIVVCALEYIRKNMNAGVNVEQIAKHCGCSKSTLELNFRKEVCQSVGKYMEEIILSESRTMLLYGDEPISEISEKLGFCDQFYFSKRFKKAYGVSPKCFRNMERK